MNDALKTRIEAAIGQLKFDDLPWNPTFAVGTCDRTGRPKISCGLRAPDSRDHLAVRTGVKAGGFNWPPHTVVLDSDFPSDNEVQLAALKSLDLAFVHEVHENVWLGDQLLSDPHV